MRPFRFGVFPSPFPLEEWIPTAHQIERLGYSTLYYCDHFRTLRNDPIALLASAAAVTKNLNLGSYVFSVDFRHPVILAKAAATLHLLSNGRFEFGIGAGWDKTEYDWAGIPYDTPRIRIQRLEEALKIIRGMWTEEKSSFSGKHYTITDIDKAGDLPEGEYPKIMVGGGGKRVLSIAGVHADIVNVVTRWRGSWATAVREATFNSLRKKVEWVKKAAKDSGRDPDDIEFAINMIWNEITDEPELAMEKIASEEGCSADEVANCPHVLVGSSSDMIERLKWIREETGISYIAARLRLEQFDEYANSIVKPLTS